MRRAEGSIIPSGKSDSFLAQHHHEELSDPLANGAGVETDDTVIVEHDRGGNTNDREKRRWYVMEAEVRSVRRSWRPVARRCGEHGGPTKTTGSAGSRNRRNSGPGKSCSAEGAGELADQRGVVRPEGIVLPDSVPFEDHGRASQTASSRR